MKAAPAAGFVGTLAEHHLETFLQLLIAGFHQRSLGGFEVKELLASQAATGALLARFLDQRPPAEQVLLQDQLEVAWGLIRAWQGLHEDAHGQESSSLSELFSATLGAIGYRDWLTFECRLMTRTIELTVADGARIHAWHGVPDRPNGLGLIVIQEVFGVTAHIRAVADDYATHGFTVLAPQVFDHIEPGVELTCDDAGMARGRELVAQLGFDAPLRDVRAAADWLLAQGCPAVGVIGYCWGGVIAYLAATRLGLPAVSYYGRLIPQFLHERPQAPLLFHFGERDALIPNAAVDAIARRLPGAPLYRYPAGHAFNRLGDPHGDRACAALAKERTLAFLREQLGQGSP